MVIVAIAAPPQGIAGIIAGAGTIRVIAVTTMSTGAAIAEVIAKMKVGTFVSLLPKKFDSVASACAPAHTRSVVAANQL